MRTNSDKEDIIYLVHRWRERSGLSLTRVAARIQAYGIDLSYEALENRLTKRLRQKPNISPELALAVIASFTEGLTSTERCTVEEALEFANLARLPLYHIMELKDFFPEGQFSEAISRYFPLRPIEKVMPPPVAIILDFNPEAKISRIRSNSLIPTEGLMPLYQGDIVHTYIGAFVSLFFKDSKLIVQVPEQNTFVIDDSVSIKNDSRSVGSLPAILAELEK